MRTMEYDMQVAVVGGVSHASSGVSNAHLCIEVHLVACDEDGYATLGNARVCQHLKQLLSRLNLGENGSVVQQLELCSKNCMSLVLCTFKRRSN